MGSHCGTPTAGLPAGRTALQWSTFACPTGSHWHAPTATQLADRLAQHDHTHPRPTGSEYHAPTAGLPSGQRVLLACMYRHPVGTPAA